MAPTIIVIRWSTDEGGTQIRVASARVGVLPQVGDGKNEPTRCLMATGQNHCDEVLALTAHDAAQFALARRQRRRLLKRLPERELLFGCEQLPGDDRVVLAERERDQPLGGRIGQEGRQLPADLRRQDPEAGEQRARRDQAGAQPRDLEIAR